MIYCIILSVVSNESYLAQRVLLTLEVERMRIQMLIHVVMKTQTLLNWSIYLKLFIPHEITFDWSDTWHRTCYSHLLSLNSSLSARCGFDYLHGFPRLRVLWIEVTITWPVDVSDVHLWEYKSSSDIFRPRVWFQRSLAKSGVQTKGVGQSYSDDGWST